MNKTRYKEYITALKEIIIPLVTFSIVALPAGVVAFYNPAAVLVVGGVSVLVYAVILQKKSAETR